VQVGGAAWFIAAVTVVRVTVVRQPKARVQRPAAIGLIEAIVGTLSGSRPAR